MWWHTVTHGRGIKGKLANGVCSQYPSHYLGTWCIQHYYRWCAHLGCQQSTELTPPPADLNRLVRFARKTKSGFYACAITFQLTSTSRVTGGNSCAEHHRTKQSPRRHGNLCTQGYGHYLLNYGAQNSTFRLAPGHIGNSRSTSIWLNLWGIRLTAGKKIISGHSICKVYWTKLTAAQRRIAVNDTLENVGTNRHGVSVPRA